MNVLLNNDISVLEPKALTSEGEHDKEKDREIAFAMWSMCLILLGMILLVPLFALLMEPFLK